MRVVAIDPGVGGGIAFCDFLIEDTFTHAQANAIPMPRGDIELSDSISKLLHGHRKAMVYIERVSGYIGKGWQPGSRMFTFGENYGFMKGVACQYATVVLVMPQRWQRALGLRNTDKLPRPQWKKFLLVHAQKRFKSLKVTGNTADALLLLDYAVRDLVPKLETS